MFVFFFSFPVYLAPSRLSAASAVISQIVVIVISNFGSSSNSRRRRSDVAEEDLPVLLPAAVLARAVQTHPGHAPQQVRLRQLQGVRKDVQEQELARMPHVEVPQGLQGRGGRGGRKGRGSGQPVGVAASSSSSACFSRQRGDARVDGRAAGGVAGPHAQRVVKHLHFGFFPGIYLRFFSSFFAFSKSMSVFSSQYVYLQRTLLLPILSK